MRNTAAPGTSRNPLLVNSIKDGFLQIPEYADAPIHVWIVAGENIGERWRLWPSGESELMEIAEPSYIDYRLAGGKDT